MLPDTCVTYLPGCSRAHALWQHPHAILADLRFAARRGLALEPQLFPGTTLRAAHGPPRVGAGDDKRPSDSRLLRRSAESCDRSDTSDCDEGQCQALHTLLQRVVVPPNGSRLSCGALMKDSFPNLRAPPASSAC